ncbi:TonB-dependent receptor plug domain-containing protein, partial [bacterium]|nr:TonB-dependent receptor plug domain-containing protein [bacterium]
MNKILLKIMIASLGLFSSSFLLADEDQNSVKGSVINNSQGIPLQGANVELMGDNSQKYGVTTDKEGKFNIDGIEDGKYKISISFIGFEDYREDVAIESGKSYKIDAVLEIQPIAMSRLEIISDATAPYQELPGAATVMGMQTIKLVNPLGTQEMLEHIPGINGFSDDGIGNSRISIGIRGLNPRRSSRALILEDGVPIQPALYVYPNMYYNPPAERIDRLEVIKGSGAINFGPQTMGGVINYFTRRPRNDFGGTFKIIAGENGFASVFSEVGGSKNEKLKPELQLLYKRGDGFRENNEFEQINATLKINYLPSLNKNVYIKSNINYENSNATYTGLTEWSFENDPKFNPKENDNFKIFRASLDLIQSERLSSVLSKNITAFTSYFDRRWWRENDVFILASDLGKESPSPANYYDPYDLVRVGNGQDSFGILRTFYVAGYEQSYRLKHLLFEKKSTLEIGARIYWERFIDDKKQGDSPNSRDGIYFIPASSEDEAPTIVGQSHHYETMAFSGFLTESIEFGSIDVRPGVRIEIFEQERIDRLAGSTYLDKTTSAILPGVGFISELRGFNFFGGVHRGF